MIQFGRCKWEDESADGVIGIIGLERSDVSGDEERDVARWNEYQAVLRVKGLIYTEILYLHIIGQKLRS